MSLLRLVAPLRVYMEIFHYRLEIMKQGLGVDAERIFQDLPWAFPGDDSDSLRKKIVDNPVEYIRRLRAIDEATVPTFKIFPDHLSSEGLRAVIADAHGVVLLTRNLLQSFISNEVAMQVGVFGGIDTSTQRIAFEPERFIGFVDFTLKHLQSGLAAARDASRCVAPIAYEDLVDASRDDQARQVLDRVRCIVPAATLPAEPLHDGPTVQDRRRDAYDKVSNPERMRAFLRAVGAEAAADGRRDLTLDEWAEVVRIGVRLC
jgi:hypothetical protein